MWLLALLVALGACALALRRRSVPAGRAPPSYPGALPLIGHGHLLASGNSVALWELFQDMCDTALLWGGVIGFRPGPKQAYIICDPDDCMTLANASLDKDIIYDFMKPIVGDGMLSGAVPIWKVHRKLLTPAFNKRVLDGFMGVFNSQARRLVSALEQESKPFDGWKYFGPHAFEVICLTAMGGATTDERRGEKYVDAVEELYNIITQRFQKPWLHSDFIFNWSPLSKKMAINAKIVHDISNSVLQSKKKELSNNATVGHEENSETRFKAFIDLILECSGEKGLLTDQEIREEVDTIIVAGHDAPAGTLVYTTLMLGSHPEVQERVLKEIKEVVGDRDVESEDLPKLVYMEAVLKEAMRLYPIGPVTVRRLTQNVKIKNYTLPAGSSVFLANYALHRHEMWGADAAQFLPERWLDSARVPAHPAAFAAFSLGRRMCIGKTYALMSMKTTLTHLVRNLIFKADTSKLRLKLDITPRPHSGHHISVERRT